MSSTVQTVMPWDVLADALRRANDPRTQQVAVVLHGGPGSGKTWVRERMPFNPGELAVVIDSDREGVRVPPVDGEADADYLARARTAAREASRARMEWAIGRRAPLYVEGLSCDPSRTILVLAALRDAGYDVFMVGLDCSRDVARARLRARAAADPIGRVVDDAVFASAYDAIPGAWARFAQLVDEFELFDTSGDEPVPCEPHANLAPVDPPKSLRDAVASMLPSPYAELTDLAVRLSMAVGRART